MYARSPYLLVFQPVTGVEKQIKFHYSNFFLADRMQHYYFAPGELAERSIAAVLKTVDCNRSWGSNP
jgi:hypothetical protein